MKIERTDKEIILRIPASIDVKVVQDVINYLTAIEIGQKSKAK